MIDLESILRAIDRYGFHVLSRVIPEDEVCEISLQVVHAQADFHAISEAQKEQTRSRGHRIGAQGVRSMRQVINVTQCFASFLASSEILSVVTALLGPWARISCTDCVINQPGNERGYWHADWPYNQTNASHIPAPYPDVLLHLSTIWMLTDFSAENGGTWILPGSHRIDQNPSDGAMHEVDRDGALMGEMQVEGRAGDVLLYDSRLWHAVAANRSYQERVGLLVRYAPWWLNLNPTHSGTAEYESMVAETGGKNYEVPPLKREVFETLPSDVQSLYRHWVDS